MKLTRAAVLEVLRLKNEGYTSYRVRKMFGISERRVNQVWQAYCQTGVVPILGTTVGRPRRPITPEERAIVRDAYEHYRVSASALTPIIERTTGAHIPHNLVHHILLEEGMATTTKPSIRRRPWVRYERKHSLSAVHMDWHQRREDGTWVCIVIDDASRYVLAAIECEHATTEATIQVLEQAMTHGKIGAVITDHGTQFTSNNDGEHRFAAFLNQHKIKHILCRVKHPQSNGKAERWFATYEQHRHAFTSIEALLHWYNAVRPHRSLDWEHLETPTQAFKRKLP